MACTINLSGIDTDCSNNRGGIRNVYIANNSDVTSVTLDEITRTISLITMNATKKFKTYKFQRNTASLSSSYTVTAETRTKTIKTDLLLKFAKITTPKAIEIDNLTSGGAELKVIVEDVNGLFWLLGSENFVQATAGSAGSGTSVTDANEFTITLSEDSEKYPPQVDAGAITGIIE